ncbi:pyridoxamine 5'-phosphate oxidase family protein [Rhodococcus sp. HNM0569]|uniref:pyridoxamine 5'-phosphate oxidase family protein n=1 Tax=Rhodococcus sp. HNM0569 TaxID=2716340 RepID=UPI00146EB581|nr:pyridoxamine 5'-phosphate oxidase family protein [Rhodococcus sp. HNM0569]NLU85167.1 pyridoxamine 5'-phosphate oxidase family protein [Rhodococcus sp. HNM0569]
MGMAVEAREELLAQPLVAALAVARDAGEPPLVVPIWYQYTPGGRPWILTGTDSVKDRLIRAAGRFSLMVEVLTPSVRYVTVEGTVASRVPGTVDMLRELSVRYLPAEAVDQYVEFASGDHGETVRIELEPTRWLSADMGSF